MKFSSCEARHAGFISSVALLFLGFFTAGSITSAETSSTKAPEREEASEESRISALEFRNIGPFRGGRSTAVSGVRGQASTFYMGTTGGGVWKTIDAGVSWQNIADQNLRAGSIGAVAVADSDPNVIYVGTGSACPRGNVSPGVGMIRSTDGGKNWDHIGLHDAGQIARIRIHPDDPNKIWVAALGHIFGPNDERGVFYSADGGQNWERVLYVSDRAGAVDLAINPDNPRVLLAAIWETERKPWTLVSGGADSGLHRSTDGGANWAKIETGLPSGTIGRIGVTISPADTDRVWALVEAEDGGLFRSEDGGETFELINPDRNFRQRAWYYTHVFADPQDSNTVYILNVGMWRSVDGGKTFSYIPGPHGDHHDLWIDPDNPEIMVNANDGGGTVTYTGGKTWSTQANQPTAEMYRVSIDKRVPFRVYGCQQDNSCVSLPSRSPMAAIERQDWWVIGGCESGHVAIDSRNPDITYSGCYGGQISRSDHRSGQDREINTYPQLAIGQAPADLRYRFQWNAPIRLSPHDQGTLYHTSQFVHRSRNEGQDWEVISPDLTRNDVEKQDFAGGPITLDNTGVEVYNTIFAFEESPQTAGLLWAGSDDGLIHISRDAGANWNNVTPAQMPEWGQVNMIELSAHDPGRAFAAVTRYKFDDFRPWIFLTNNYGESWTQIADGANGIPKNHFVRVVREDPTRQGLLFAGTEFGLYNSNDDGTTWREFQLNLPRTPITDMAVAQKDLVVATQGRSFWILDDLSPLHQIEDPWTHSGPTLLAPRSALRYGGGSSFSRPKAVGKNPPYGAMINYWLTATSDDEVILEILDSEGEILRTLSNLKEEPQAPDPWRGLRSDDPPIRKLPSKQGLNRYVWDLRLKDAELIDDAVLWGSGKGPRVPPGQYQARLTIGDWSDTQSFEVAIDPRVSATQEDLEAQFALAKEIWITLNESHRALARLRDVRQQVSELTVRLEAAGYGQDLEEAATAIDQRFTEFERMIYQSRSEAPQDILNYPPQLDAQLLELLGNVQSADARPTTGAIERFEDVRDQLKTLVDEVESVMASDLASFNELVQVKQVPAVIVPSR